MRKSHLASKMASNVFSCAKLKRLFPLKTIDNVVKVFERELDGERSPNLTTLSLIIGLIEHNLTSSKNLSTFTTNSATTTNATTTNAVTSNNTGSNSNTTTTTANGNQSSSTSTRNKHSTSAARTTNGTSKEPKERGHTNGSYEDHALLDGGEEFNDFPTVHWNTIEAFYQKFKSQIKGSVDLSQYPRKTSRELIKRVSDVIWSNLTRSYYKDKAHLQSLFSYLTGNKLDCFGVAYAVVAACQILGLNDVRLALSEDHAWVVFGEEGAEDTAEVTWHGKGNEDKRGQPVVAANCWLYLNGYAVACTTQMTVAALVSAINPSINATTDSEQLGSLQQKLLWLLYERGYLSRYPMAVGNLGDLEEICPTLDSPKTSVNLFHEAIDIAKNYYANHHVYPYTYLAGYLFRNGRFKEALATWANAATVVRNYNYTRDDEEIYKEFLEIANELIPHIVKVVSAGGCEPSRMSSIPLLQDPDCFASLLRFYDGLCGWEEGSTTPVLHIGWAKPFVATISKFTAFTRAKVRIHVKTEDEEEKSEEKVNETKSERLKESRNPSRDNELNGNSNGKSPPPPLKTPDEILKSIEEEIDRTVSMSEGVEDDDDNGSTYTFSKIAELAAACGEKILNPDYLLGNSTEPTLDVTPNPAGTVVPPKTEQVETPVEEEDLDKKRDPDFDNSTDEESEEDGDTAADGRPVVCLVSQKMVGLKDLLRAEKLNTSAIQLQLTAQSQVHLTKRQRVGSFGSHPHAELDFVATTTTNPSAVSVPILGQRTSKRIRRE